MKKVAIVTATRAEYGLLSPVIKALRKYESSDFIVKLIVTGTHLYESYGNTIKEIENDNVRIDYRISIAIDNESDKDVSTNQADALVKFTNHFSEEQYDGVILLGDRYEMLAIAIAAGNTKTPIFHLCGGDTTEGAMDEWIRHSITKMSYLHFTTNEVSRKRVVQLGEEPQRVFNYGSTSIDNIIQLADMSKEDALRSIGLSDCKYALCTYHPVTLETETVENQIEELLTAIKSFPNIQFIVTKSNADQGGEHINELLDKAVESVDNIHVYASLGVKRYLSLMKHSEFVIGNSSSGIIETPAFHIPTVNIGDRQRGRLQSESIINCRSNSYSIINAITMALTDEYKKICQKSISQYGDGHAANRIADKVVEVIKDGRIDLKKKFYDLDYK